MNITFNAVCRPLHNNTATQSKMMNFYQKFIIAAVNEIVSSETPSLQARVVLQRMLADEDARHIYSLFEKVVDAADKAVPNNVREIAEKAAAGAKEDAEAVYTAAWSKARAAYLANYRKAIRQGMDSLAEQWG